MQEMLENRGSQAAWPRELNACPTISDDVGVPGPSL